MGHLVEGGSIWKAGLNYIESVEGNHGRPPVTRNLVTNLQFCQLTFCIEPS
jgi:hypothetical protein